MKEHKKKLKESIVNFGKYEGFQIWEVPDTYLYWVYHNYKDLNEKCPDLFKYLKKKDKKGKLHPPYRNNIYSKRNYNPFEDLDERDEMCDYSEQDIY